LACVIVFLVSDIQHLLPILAAIAAGTAIGVVGAYRVQMTQMPQLVALFNGVGGGRGSHCGDHRTDRNAARHRAGV
jgi:NAD(P) transhydrogenase subunit beta